MNLRDRYSRRSVENFVASVIGYQLGLVDVNHVRKHYMQGVKINDRWYEMFHAIVMGTVQGESNTNNS